MDRLPVKTVERLSLYRRLLLRYQYLDRAFIFSKDLARLLNINPVHVRRDLMLLGVSGSHSEGYSVQTLISKISDKLCCSEGRKACIIGFGHMGRAVLELFGEDFSPVKIKAIFDSSPKAIGKTFSGVPCFTYDKIMEVIESEGILMAVLTDADDDLESLIDLLTSCGIQGIMNLTPARLKIPGDIHLEEFDMITTMIKLAYFSTNK